MYFKNPRLQCTKRRTVSFLSKFVCNLLHAILRYGWTNGNAGADGSNGPNGDDARADGNDGWSDARADGYDGRHGHAWANGDDARPNGRDAGDSFPSLS